jgi:hypothetical protein
VAKRLKKRVIAEKFRCRKCGVSKVGDDFYRSTEPDLDLNLKMSVCKSCVKDITDGFIDSEKAMDKGILKTCRKLNVLFDKELCDRTVAKVQEIEQGGKATEMVFGFYLRFLFAKNADGKDLTFEELENEVAEPETVETLSDTNPKMTDWEKRWGRGFSESDYEFLEEEFAGWSEDRKTLTKEDITLLEEICHLKLHIRKTRNPENPAEDLVKQLQGLVKSANEQLKVNKEQEEEGLEAISSIIKIMETSYPADIYKDKSLYTDYDYDMTQYYEKHSTRPTKNFASGTRDFDFDMDSEKDDDEVEVDASLPQKEDDD